ncbi:hypothetical protein [Pantanalinema sp. GBBB05]|uniref:hypothetical protein n=1 Tax=Pantanalinema sp. GBBB05 TaxID=2604139 RepID=UPI001E172BFF|nr:hypothetical protein [Pantanalinema sp. GBBB05]
MKTRKIFTTIALGSVLAISVSVLTSITTQARPGFRGESPEIRDCPPTFSPKAFQGRTGKVAFYNAWAVPAEVVLYHPNSQSVYNTYTVAPHQNEFLGDITVGDDWGVCVKYNGSAFRSGFVNNLGRIAIYNPDYQGNPLFMIQNDRIK